jgi:hypothetical protein
MSDTSDDRFLKAVAGWNGEPYFLTDDGIQDAYCLAARCASLATRVFSSLAAGLPWDEVSNSIAELHQAVEDGAYPIEAMYQEFVECGLRVKVGEIVDEISAHKTALALGHWVIEQIWLEADDIPPLAPSVGPFDFSLVQANYQRVVRHFATLPALDTRELEILLTQEAILANRARGREYRRLSDSVDHRPAGRDGQASRLQFDDQAQTVQLDGRTIPVSSPKAYLLYEVVAEREGAPITRAEIKRRQGGFRGDKTIRKYRDLLPIRLRRTIKSGGTGYYLHCPLPLQ